MLELNFFSDSYNGSGGSLELMRNAHTWGQMEIGAFCGWVNVTLRVEASEM